MKKFLRTILLLGIVFSFLGIFSSLQNTQATIGQGGPLILMGIDAEDGGVNGHGPIEVYVNVSNTVNNAATNGGNGFLVIGGGKIATDDVTEFWDEISLQSGIPVTYVNGATNIANQSFAGFRVIVVVSDLQNTPGGGLRVTENAALTNRQGDITNFVNAGGGLLGFSQTGFAQPYAYLPSFDEFSFEFPPQFENITPTAEGTTVGITDELDVCCWHDEYITFPNFLRVLATNDLTGNPSAIGGLNVFLSSIQLAPINAEINTGQNHTLTATVIENGLPFENTLVTFDILTGPNEGKQFTATTNAQGQANTSYTSQTIGTDTVRASYVSPTSGTPTPSPPVLRNTENKTSSTKTNNGAGGTTIQSNVVSVNWVSTNSPPVCTDATPSITQLPIPNRSFTDVSILNISDPDSDPLTINVTSVTQDEPIDHIGNGDFTPDAVINGSTASLRAESIIGTVVRNGATFVGDGRYYHITFTATDIANETCSGTVSVTVPHVRTATPIDGGSIFQSAGQSQTLFSDFNGDQAVDFSIYRNGTWYSRQSSNGAMNVEQFGVAGDIPVPADYDGDGISDKAIWRNIGGSGYYYIMRSSNNQLEVNQFGIAGDNPKLVGDWDNDGQADLAVYRIQSNGKGIFYYQSSSNGSLNAFTWGIEGDQPVRGDFDGDGAFDFAVFRETNGVWYIVQSSNGEYRFEQWGTNGDKTIAADFDGDSVTDVAVFRPSNGTWYIKQSLSGEPRFEQWGSANDKIVANDYDGDRKADLAVWRESSQSVLYVRQSSNNSPLIVQWGINGDVPVFSND